MLFGCEAWRAFDLVEPVSQRCARQPAPFRRVAAGANTRLRKASWGLVLVRAGNPSSRRTDIPGPNRRIGGRRGVFLNAGPEVHGL